MTPVEKQLTPAGGWHAWGAPKIQPFDTRRLNPLMRVAHTVAGKFAERRVGMAKVPDVFLLLMRNKRLFQPWLRFAAKLMPGGTLGADAARAQHVFSGAGSYPATVTVTDSAAHSAQASVGVTVGPAPVDPGKGTPPPDNGSTTPGGGGATSWLGALLLAALRLARRARSPQGR